MGIRDWLSKPTGFLTTAIGLVTAIAGFVTLFRTDTKLATWTAVIVAISAAVLTLLYVAFSKEIDLLGSSLPRFSKRRRAGAAISAACLVAGAVAGGFYVTTRPEDHRRRLVICEFDATPNGALIQIRQRLYDSLEQRLHNHHIDNVVIEMDGTIVKSADEVRVIAAKHNAAAVIWGWADAEAVGIRVFMPEPRIRLIAPEPEHVPWDLLPMDATIGTHGKNILQHASFISMFVVGQLLFLDNRWAEGAAAFDEAMKVLPADAKVHNPAIAHFFHARALHFSQPRDIDDKTTTRIVCEYAEALRLQPTMYQALNNLGILYGQRSEYHVYSMDAVPDESCLAATGIQDRNFFEAALKLRPDIAALEYNRLASEWTTWHEYNEERDASFADALHAVLRKDPSLFGAHLMLGVIAFDRGDYGTAQREFEVVAREHPELEGIHANIGQAARCRGDRETARAAFARELARNPRDRIAKIALASMDFAAGNIQRAESLEPIDSVSQLLRAAAYSRRGDLGSAANLIRHPPPDVVELSCMRELLDAVIRELSPSNPPSYDGSCRDFMENRVDREIDSPLERASSDLVRECVKGDSVPYRWLREHCLPRDPHAAIDALFLRIADATKEELHTRRVRYAYSACPYAFVEHAGKWQFATAILVNHRGPERDELSKYDLPRSFNGSLRIREQEAEVTYLDHVRVQYLYDSGAREDRAAGLSKLASIDRRYAILHLGDELVLKFPPPRKSPARVILVAKGYYVSRR